MCLVGASLECCFIMRSVPLHSLQSTSACVHMDLHMGGEEGIWEQGGPGLCLLPSVHSALKLNSNKIRHRCALLASTSIVRKPSGGPVTRGWMVQLLLSPPEGLLKAALCDNHNQNISNISCSARLTPLRTDGSAGLQRAQTRTHQSGSRLTLIGQDNSRLFSEKRCPLTSFALMLAVISVSPEFLPVSASCFKSFCIGFLAWN